MISLFSDYFSVDKQNGKSEQTKPKRGLPHQCLYLSWVLCALVIAICSVLLVLYGMSFGNTTSWMWLATIFISLFKDIFAVQPMKIFLASLFTSFVLKKIGSQDENYIHTENKWQLVEQAIFGLHSVLPPDEDNPNDLCCAEIHCPVDDSSSIAESDNLSVIEIS